MELFSFSFFSVATIIIFRNYHYSRMVICSIICFFTVIRWFILLREIFLHWLLLISKYTHALLLFIYLFISNLFILMHSWFWFRCIFLFLCMLCNIGRVSRGSPVMLSPSRLFSFVWLCVHLSTPVSLKVVAATIVIVSITILFFV